MRRLVWRLFVIGVLVGGGFYIGVRFSPAVTAGTPVWALRLLHFPAPAAPRAAVPTADAVSPPAAKPAAPPPARQSADANPSPDAAAPGGTPPTHPDQSPDAADKAGGDTDPSSSGDATTSLSQNVDEYNGLLRRIQSIDHIVAALQKRASDPSTPSQDVAALLEEQNTLLSEAAAAVQRCADLKSRIASDPGYSSQYTEGARCLTPGQIAGPLLNTGLDDLRFVRKR